MPSNESILSGLAGLANNWQGVAIAFHVYFGILIIAIAAGIKIPRRIAAILLVIPLLSVSVLAWSSGNPFNGTLFALAAIAMIVIALRLPVGRISAAPVPVVNAGSLLLAFGWVYPHFLNTTSFLPYLYAAPVGIVPCPTLSSVIGMTLIFSSFESRGWAVASGATGLVYGLFGALRLGVAIDWVLIVGAVGLLYYAFASKRMYSSKTAGVRRG